MSICVEVKIPNNVTLFEHQKQGIDFLISKRRAGLWDDMGLGKTCQALLAMNVLAINPVLIVCPATVKGVWEKEIAKWVPDAKVIKITGQKMARLWAFKVDIPEVRPDFIIINYELLDKHLPEIYKLPIGGLIFDEGHKVKNREAKMHKASSKIVKKFSYVPCFVLDGTPILNRTEELWSMLHLIDPNGHSSFWKWAQDHLQTQEAMGWGNKWKINIVGGPKDPDAFKAYVSNYGLRRLKEDCIDLPEKTYETLEVELTGDQRKAYDSMANDYFVQLEGMEDEVAAMNVVSMIQRLKQIAISPDLLDPLSKSIQGAKIDVLEELLEDCGDQQVVVFSQFKRVCYRLYDKFNRKYRCDVFTGDDSQTRRQRAIEAFQAGRTKVLFVSTLAGGVGVTLTAGTIAIFTDLLWTPALNAQAVDRLHRISQKMPVTIYTLKAVNTIEDRILEVLGHKQALFDLSIPVDKRVTKDWRQLFGK